MITKKKVNSLIDSKLEDTDQFLVDLEISIGNNIQVFIDGDSGVTISDCKMLSKFIESELDREEEDFSLHVSSSGLDKPLKLLRQYEKNIGRKVEITLLEGEPISGKLVKCDENEISLEIEIKKSKKKKKEEEEEIDPIKIIPFSSIKQTLVVISFK